jgi:hypothetical protein
VTGLFRCALIVIAVALCGAIGDCATAAPPPNRQIEIPTTPETWPSDIQPLPEGPPPNEDFLAEQYSTLPTEEPFADVPEDSDPVIDLHADCESPSPTFLPSPRWFGLRHSSTHGRHVHRGRPFTGTSWRNRPWYIGGDIGMMWLTTEIDDDITRDSDLFGGIFAGYDWDHYWGAELSLHRATPELINRDARDADRGDRMMIWSANMLYYPWGDSMIRPYWRAGIGVTEIDYPNDDGERVDEGLWTFPLGVGVKYPIKRWLAARAELTDHIGLGTSDVNMQHNVSLTFGLECRYGAHPRSYWPWNPDRHIW